jgi:hypothetical protein
VTNVNVAADRLAHDLATLGLVFRVEIVTGDSTAPLRAAAESELVDVPTPVPEYATDEIVVRHASAEHMRLVFHGASPFCVQFAELLEQVQVVVAEVTGERWPWCASHGVWATPEVVSGVVVWMCSGGHVIARVGDLDIANSC